MSRTVQYEGRLLYGRSSSDVEGYVAGARSDNPRNGSFDSERWLAQTRVEGRFPLGNGTILVPLADAGHVRSSADGFDYESGKDPEEKVRIAVSRLQLGTDFEIPIDTAEGELIFRPGMSYALSDRDGGEYGKSDRASSGQIDFSVDCRLDDSISLGFRGHYSGFGGSGDVSSFGAGLDIQAQF